MMTYEVNYSKIEDLIERDAKAIQDTLDYMGKDLLNTFLTEAKKCTTAEHVQSMNFAFAFAGVNGLPFHAIMRSSCREAYKLWCASDLGGTPIKTDELGYWIKEDK